MYEATTDAAWWLNDRHKLEQRYTDFTTRSVTLPLRDGTRIALYLYFPAGVAPEMRLPTVMMMTPYFSAMEYRSRLFEALIRRLTPAVSLETAEIMARYGFAVALMDLRGSGGSSGKRKAIFMPDAVRDGAQVVDWIVAQPWSNGNVGATGVSGVGMTANWLLTAKHPAVKAVAPRFTVFDIYNATHTGGISANTFVQDIGAILRGMDANRLYEMSPRRLVQWVLRAMIRGLKRADDDVDRRQLAAAVAEHEGNEYFDHGIIGIDFRDDLLPGSSTEATIDSQAPMSHAPAMEASGAAIYALAGWLDGAFCRELVHLHRTVRTPGSKLTIGPWGHGGRFYTSPVVRERRPTEFDQARELVRFFEHHLAGADNGIDREPPIHYFTMGAEERWKSCEEWPPPGAMLRVLRCAARGRLLAGDRAVEPGSDVHRVDFSSSTGPDSRLGRHLAGGRYPVRYPNRKRRDAKLLTYTSEPLTDTAEVTGHPLVTLYLSSSTGDAAVFAYMEDVAPSGEVFNVTEGYLRLRDRALTAGPPPYRTAVPWRAHLRADAAPLPNGQVAELHFDLLPVSYRFGAGHSIRLTIAGADADNFEQIPADGSVPKLRVHRGGGYDSRIEIPVYG